MALKYKVFTPDKNNKMSFTKQELENLLTEVYNEGYRDGQSSNWYINYGGSPFLKPTNKINCNDSSVTGNPPKDDIMFTTTTIHPRDVVTCLYSSPTISIQKTKE